MMIGSCNSPITLSNYNFADSLEQKTVPIIYEEIAIVMINVLKRRKWNHVSMLISSFLYGVQFLCITCG